MTEPEYTAVLMQGSGTFGVESVLTSTIGDGDHLLIAANGSYGLRMKEIADHAGISCTVYETAYDEIPDAAVIKKFWKRIRRSLMQPWCTVRPPPGF